MISNFGTGSIHHEIWCNREMSLHGFAQGTGNWKVFRSMRHVT